MRTQSQHSIKSSVLISRLKVNNTEPGKIFLVVVLSLALGVPLALFTVYYFAESTKYLVAVVLILLSVLVFVGLVLAIFWKAIARQIFQRPISTVSDALDPLVDVIGNVGDSNYSAAKDNFRLFSESAASIYSWMITRQWALSGALGLLLGFSALVGSALLKQQNDLITEQNQFFRQQIDQQQEQILAQQRLANQTTRNEAINRIYGAAFSDSPRVRAEAVRSLVAVERVLIDSGSNTLPTDYINLHSADLTDAWLSNADLKNISFRKANLSGANLSSADLTGSVFRFAILEGTDVLSSNATNAQFAFVRGTGSTFDSTNLSNANLNQSDFSDSNFSGADFSNANVYKVNFSGADLSSIRNWETISSIEGTNLHNLAGSPDGFLEWALSNGAIANEGALGDLDNLRTEMIKGEEGR